MLSILAISILPILVAWLLDKILGDPMWLPHPVVLFGKIIHKCETILNKGHWKRTKGAVMAVVLIIMTFVLTDYLLKIALDVSVYLWMTVTTILVFYCLAGTTLIREVRQVFYALDISLPKGRERVARIVGRDTANLTAQEVRSAALETLSENLSDGVVAPLFWLVLLGVPGMMAYKMVNTLDSMIGYHNERYLRFGTWAARIDDVANYIPARLTALMMILTSSFYRWWSRLRFVVKYGRMHASPNSGYPEAALASILDCRFGGSHDYFGQRFYKPYIGDHDRQLSTKDMIIAIGVNQRVEIVMMVIVCASILFCVQKKLIFLCFFS